MHKKTISFYFVFTFIFFQTAMAQKQALSIPHLQTVGSSKQLIVTEKPFIMLAGELHNSSSSCLNYMEPVWNRLIAFNLNTVLAPVSWEMIEPVEGQFDFTNVEGLIAKARINNLKLVFLWFGTWKNACSSYAPAWVRQNTKRFVRSESFDGTKLNNLSSLCSATCLADSKAFAALMKHIKTIDEIENTVLAIQVQNEPGIRGDSRDRSNLANKAFNKTVPFELMNFLKENKERLIPEMLKIWGNSGFKNKGTWSDVFGDNADWVFMTWHTASYIDKVAAAGKAIYPIPMFANAWIGKDEQVKAGDFPSGGPVASMIPVWQAAAPHIDILAPDIYRKEFVNACILFQRMNNPLFIPEIRSSGCSANAFYAFGQGAICFSPFGIDNINTYPVDHPIGKSYQLLTQLMPYLQQYQGTGKMVGVVGNKDEKQEIIMGNYKLLVEFTGNINPEIPGSGIIFALADDEFLIAGKGIKVTFLSGKNFPKRTEILMAYELVYKNSNWEKQRRLNGDETGGGSDHNIQLQLTDENLSVKTAKVFSYE